MQEIDSTTSSINARIEAIQAKIRHEETDFEFEIRSADSYQSNSHILDFFDKEWHPSLEKAENGDFNEALKSIEEVYQNLINEKADKSFLSDKSDRNYVDNKIKDLEGEISAKIQHKIADIYQPIQDQLDQARNNSEAIHQYFSQTTMTIRKELQSLRKKYEQKDEPEVPKLHPISSPIRHFQKPRSKTEPLCVVLSSPYKRQMPYHSPLKQKKKVTVPELPELIVSHHDI